MQSLPKILLVEDDRSIAGALATALRHEYDLDIASSGKLGIYKADAEDYAIVVLDLNLPDISGIHVCQQLRERGYRAAVLILSGETKVMTKIQLLDTGANDYLTKPFSLGELKARLRALTRTQPASQPAARKLVLGNVELDRQTYSVIRDGQPVQLRRKEFSLLECLMEHAGTVVSRETLASYAWHGSDALWTNTVDVHIKHLRDKVDRPFDQPMIRTVHGIGYKIENLQTAEVIQS